MSDHSEARTVAFFKFYDPSGVQVNFTIRGGTDLAAVGEDMAVVKDTLASLGTYGFTVNLVDGTGGEFDDVRDGTMWVRAVSRGGHDCLYTYADHEQVQNKTVTCWPEIIQALPITQDEWDNAKVWNQAQAPTKDFAAEGGFLNHFPHEVKFGMRDTGKTFTLPDGRTVPVLKAEKVLNAGPGGVNMGVQTRGDDMDQTGGQPPMSAPVGQKKAVNTSAGQCPHCNAPAGKPHGMVKGQPCPNAQGGSAPVQKATGSGRSFPKATGPGKNAPSPKATGPGKNAPSHRQTLSAQLMMMGKALYDGSWDATRAAAVRDMGVESGSASDLDDAQLTALVNQLKETMIEGMFEFAGAAEWTDQTVNEYLSSWDFKGLENWDGDPVNLPVQFVVKLFEQSTVDAANA